MDFLAQWQTTLLGTVVVSLLVLLVLGWLLYRLQQSEVRQQDTSASLQASEDRFQLLLNAVGDGICGMDQDGRCMFANPAACQLLGHESETALLGSSCCRWCIPTAGPPAPARWGECHSPGLAPGRSAHADDALFTRADHSLLPVRYDAYPLVKDGRDIGAVLLFQDIGEGKRQQEQIAFLAHHDALTGLPNRILAEDRFGNCSA
jgi:PAS domain S-box-containing protein